MNPDNSLSSLLLMVIYERTMLEIFTKYYSEESFPKDNKGAQAACQLHLPQQGPFTFLIKTFLFQICVFMLFGSDYNDFAGWFKSQTLPHLLDLLDCQKAITDSFPSSNLPCTQS